MFLVYWSGFGSILLSFMVIMIIRDKRKNTRLPPGPPGWPIVGNLFMLGKKPNEDLLGLAKKYGPLMSLQLGMKTAVVVSSPAMAKEFLKNNDQVFASRTVIQAAKCLSYNTSSLVWGHYGPRWRMLRRICSTELFSAKKLNALQHLRKDQVFETIRLIYGGDYLQGKAVNIAEIAFLLSFNLLGNMTFGQNMFGHGSEGAREFKEALSKASEVAATPNLADFFPFLQILDPQGISRHTTVFMKQAFGLLNTFIDDRLSSSTRNSGCAVNHADLLDVLLDRRTDGDDESSRFTRTDMMPFLVDLFVGGTDTTATTIEWGMTELVRNPRTMKRAQAELEHVVGRDRKVEESDIEHLPYLQAVVKEVFRLHPAAPLLLPHRAENSREIAGFVIPKDSQVIFNVWAIGRDPSVWDSALDFVPERFMDRKTDYKGNDFELIPFGAGRRICPGLALGSRVVHFVLASLLHSFDWCLPDGQKSEQMDMSEKFGITLQKDLPLIAIPTPRLSADLY